MLLFQASQGDELTQMVLTELRKHCPALEYLHFFRESGSGSTERYGDDINGTFGNRSIGEAFAEQTVAPVYGNFALKILGRTIKLDVAYEERGGDVPSEFRLKLKNWGENAGRDLMGKLLNDNATTDAEQFNGIRKLLADQVTAGDATRVITAATNGLQVVLGNDNTAKTAHQKFVELIEELCDAVDGGPNLILMDMKVLTRLSTVAKDQCSISLNQFGATIGDFRGIPIVPTGRTYSGARIIPATETVGTATDCTGIFAFRSSEKSNLTAMTTPVGFRVYPMQKVGSMYEVMPQLQMDLGALSKRCIAKLAGIRL
jgi:hypothetical protein